MLILVDIPKIVIAGVLYALALLIFYPIKGSFFSIILLVEVLYFSAYAMGYFVSIIFKANQVALVGTGFALLWGMVLSGVIPSLRDVNSQDFYQPIHFLWDISPPRYGVEAFWTKQVAATPFNSTAVPATMGYSYENYNYDISMILLLTFAWTLVSFFALKLTHRSKQK